MASIAQLTSEILHGVGQPNNHTLRERVRNAIIHTRNELIRRSYEIMLTLIKFILNVLKFHLLQLMMVM